MSKVLRNTLFIFFTVGGLHVAAQTDNDSVSLPTSLSTHMIQVNGVDLYYERSGKGRPLLLLHGWTQTSSFWKPYLSQLKDKFELYAIDLRGHGSSSPLTADFSIQKAAGDVAELIRKLEIGPVSALGISYGGLILLEIAAAEPGLLDDLILVGTSYHYDGREAQKGKAPFAYDDLSPSFKSLLMLQHKHGETQIRELFNPGLNYRIALSKEQLSAIRSRTLIIHGEKDEIAEVKQAQEMASLIPASELWVVPQTGHLALTAANHVGFFKRVRQFLRKDQLKKP